MKSVARSLVWWPSIDADIEAKVHACVSCQANAENPARAPLHPWKWPEQPRYDCTLIMQGHFWVNIFSSG